MKIEKINEKFGKMASHLLKIRWLALLLFAVVIGLSVCGVKNGSSDFL